MARAILVDEFDLERSVTSDQEAFDSRLASWAIEMVSDAAIQVTKQTWQTAEDVPAGCISVLTLAARRLYTNPDRFTREAEGDYSYGLDATVTKADIFTPGELSVLQEYSKAPRVKGLGTLGTYRGDIGRTGTVYVPDGTAFGFPWYQDGA